MTYPSPFSEKSDAPTKEFLPLMLQCLQEVSDELLFLTKLFEENEYGKCPEVLHTTLKKKIYASHEDIGKLYAWTENVIRLGCFASSASEKTLLLALCADIEANYETMLNLAPVVVKFNTNAPPFYFMLGDTHIDWLTKELESRVDEE